MAAEARAQGGEGNEGEEGPRHAARLRRRLVRPGQEGVGHRLEGDGLPAVGVQEAGGLGRGHDPADLPEEARGHVLVHGHRGPGQERLARLEPEPRPGRIHPHRLDVRASVADDAVDLAQLVREDHVTAPSVCLDLRSAAPSPPPPASPWGSP